MQELQQFKVERISIHLYCGSHDGGQKNAHQSLFPYGIIENSRTSLAHNSVLIVQITSNLVQMHVVWSHRSYQNLGQIDHNLHSHVFDDVICKPPIYLFFNTLNWKKNEEAIGTQYMCIIRTFHNHCRHWLER